METIKERASLEENALPKLVLVVGFPAIGAKGGEEGRPDPFREGNMKR